MLTLLVPAEMVRPSRFEPAFDVKLPRVVVEQGGKVVVSLKK